MAIGNGLIPFVRLNIKFGPRLANHRGICLGNTLLNFAHTRVSTVCSSVIRFTRLRSFVSRGLGGCSSNVRIHLTFSITVGTRNSVLILSRILTINSRTFRHGYSGFFTRVGGSPAGAIVLIARSVSSIGGCYGGTVLVGSNRVVTDNSGGSITSHCALRGLGSRRGRQGRGPRSRCSLNLDRGIPAFQVLPISPRVSSYTRAFRFSIRCSLHSDSNKRFCVPVSILSIGHNNIPCSYNITFGFDGTKRGGVRFTLPLDVFGSKSFGVVTAVHGVPSASGLEGFRRLTFADSRGSYCFSIQGPKAAGFTKLLGSGTLRVSYLKADHV